MTGDETNVDSSLPTINHESQAPAASNTGKEENIDPENNELTQRLHRLSESWTAEREDHKGRCRTLDVLLGVEGPWLFDFLYRCQGTLKNLSAQISQLQERNGKLQRINDDLAQDPQCLARIADLEKRNAELEEHIRRLGNFSSVEEWRKYHNEVETLEAALKTAEDKLAAVTEENKELRIWVERDNDPRNG